MNTDILYIMAGYVIILCTTIGFLQWMTKGFLTNYLKVKASRGKLQLLLIKTITDSYWGNGQFSKDDAHEGALTYKNRNKVQKLITNITQTDIDHIMGVSFIIINDSLDMVIGQRHVLISKEHVGLTLETGLVVTEEMVGKTYVYQVHIPMCSPQKADFFIDRAQKLPQKGGKTIMLLVGLIVFAMLLIGIDIYYSKNAVSTCQVLGGMIQNVSTTMNTIL